MNKNKNGSAIVMLFIAVALFGMIGYAFLQESRSNIDMIESEADKGKSYQYQDCSNAMAMATKRLDMRGCGDLISLAKDGSNTKPGAPTDGSCSVFHPKGGGIKPCTVDPESQCETKSTLVIGDVCGSMVYAGLSPDGNKRMFATLCDGGMIWNGSACTGSQALVQWGYHFQNKETSMVDGDGNTADLPLSPAATACTARADGGFTDWYLPSRDELNVLYINRAAIKNFTEGDWIFYWSSSTGDRLEKAFSQRFTNGYQEYGGFRNSTRPYRCVRKND